MAHFVALVIGFKSVYYPPCTSTSTRSYGATKVPRGAIEAFPQYFKYLAEKRRPELLHSLYLHIGEELDPGTWIPGFPRKNATKV